MFAPDGTLLWSGRGQKVAKSQPYNPDLAVSATQTGQAVYDEGRVPNPPEILPVAQEVAAEIVKSMPDLSHKQDGKPESAAPASSGSDAGGW